MHDASFDLSQFHLNLLLTLDSGQAFRWRPLDNLGKEWIGLISDTLIKVSAKSAKMLTSNQK
ncbi:MAG: DNA glycosylase, partial [Rhabdochlamydiaceae bacterium]